ncbi:hypothetical protein LAZ67_1008074 [Cordylochernes scorpioides]|uniref:Uncharacterized protein n=1 Tax=Cordylochernes scorpioides TaxID=51811 RepID=A0ABY6K031_9ARAC|nr:hypothetical protein LAZ67_1008074 [Cordylochernes scorpioides]
MAPVMKSAIDDLLSNLDEVKEQDDIEIYQIYKRLTMDVIGRTAFGIQTQVQKNPDHDVFLKYSQGFFARIPGYFELFIAAVLTYLSPLSKKSIEISVNPSFFTQVKLRCVCDACAQDDVREGCVQARRPDILQLMLDTEMTEEQMDNATLTAGEDDDRELSKSNGQHLTSEYLSPNFTYCIVFLYETTSTALAFITYTLVKYPEVQEKVRKEIQEIVESDGQVSYASVQKLQYLEAVCNEALRIYPPIYMFVSRQAGENVTYGSYTIPKGISIQVPAYTIHHDPDLWPDPECFNPDRVGLIGYQYCILKVSETCLTHNCSRFIPENKKSTSPFAFQTFGAGPRNCIGMRFAQMEIKMALASILLKFRLLPGKSFEEVSTTQEL